MPIDFSKFQKKTEVKKKPEKLVIRKFITTEKTHEKSIIESDEISMDEARAQYIVICKKKPKHDSIQTKDWLINEVIKVLEKSKNKKGVGE